MSLSTKVAFLQKSKRKEYLQSCGFSEKEAKKFIKAHKREFKNLRKKI